MSGVIEAIADYPQEGFSLLKDDNGCFLAFKGREDFLPIDETPEINFRRYMRQNPYSRRVAAVFQPARAG